MNSNIDFVNPFPMEIAYRCQCAICGVVHEQRCIGGTGAHLYSPSRPPWKLIDEAWVCPAHKVEQITKIDGLEGQFDWENDKPTWVANIYRRK